MILKKLYLKFLSRYNPVLYAKRVGVNVFGKNQKFISRDFGSEPWLITIGDHVELSYNVSFVTHDGAPWIFRKKEEFAAYKSLMKFGKIKIEDNCFIGANSIIMGGVTIHKNSIVGAGSIVTRDVPEYSVVAGVPAKVICSVYEYAERMQKNSPNYNVSLVNKNADTKKTEVLRALNEKETQ